MSLLSCQVISFKNKKEKNVFMTSNFWMVVYVYNNLVSLKNVPLCTFFATQFYVPHVSPQFQREMSTELH